jgi:CheY-like chemotaxis protein
MQLARMDVATHRAENGRVAIDVLVDSLPDRFDMVLMDLRMPVMDGLEATRKIRTELGMRDLPVVALTGEMIGGCRAECEGVGFDDYFQKPMKKDKLEALVNKYRDLRRDGGNGGGGGGEATPTAATTTTTSRRVSTSGASFSGGLVRTTSGTSVRDLVRRHRSRQSMEGMAEAPQPPTGTGGGSGGDFDLVRPPPSRRGTAEGSNAVVRDVVDAAAFDLSMPLSVLIVEDTDVCECGAPLRQVLTLFCGPPFYPRRSRLSLSECFLWTPAFLPRFSSRHSQSFVRLKNETKRKQAPNS